MNNRKNNDLKGSITSLQLDISVLVVQLLLLYVVAVLLSTFSISLCALNSCWLLAIRSYTSSTLFLNKKKKIEPTEKPTNQPTYVKIMMEKRRRTNLLLWFQRFMLLSMYILSGSECSCSSSIRQSVDLLVTL